MIYICMKSTKIMKIFHWLLILIITTSVAVTSYRTLFVKGAINIVVTDSK